MIQVTIFLQLMGAVLVSLGAAGLTFPLIPESYEYFYIGLGAGYACLLAWGLIVRQTPISLMFLTLLILHIYRFYF